MDNISKAVKPVDKFISVNISPVVNNSSVSVILLAIVLLNVVFSADKIPTSIKNIITHPVVMYSSILLYIYQSYGSITPAIISGIAVVIFYYAFNFVTSLLKEHFKIISPGPDVYPGCVDIKVTDLLALFDGDRGKLATTMQTIGVPEDTYITDENAPIIATYLINFGHNVTNECAVPR